MLLGHQVLMRSRGAICNSTSSCPGIQQPKPGASLLPLPTPQECKEANTLILSPASDSNAKSSSLDFSLPFLYQSHPCFPSRISLAPVKSIENELPLGCGCPDVEAISHFGEMWQVCALQKGCQTHVRKWVITKQAIAQAESQGFHQTTPWGFGNLPWCGSATLCQGLSCFKSSEIAKTSSEWSFELPPHFFAICDPNTNTLNCPYDFLLAGCSSCLFITAYGAPHHQAFSSLGRGSTKWEGKSVKATFFSNSPNILCGAGTAIVAHTDEKMLNHDSLCKTMYGVITLVGSFGARWFWEHPAVVSTSVVKISQAAHGFCHPALCNFSEIPQWSLPQCTFLQANQPTSLDSSFPMVPGCLEPLTI